MLEGHQDMTTADSKLDLVNQRHQPPPLPWMYISPTVPTLEPL